MKNKIRFLSLLLAVFVLLSTLPAAAEATNYAKDAQWEKYMSAGKVTQKTDDGTYWAATGITTAYGSVGIDMLPAVRAALKKADDEEVTVYLTWEAKFVPSGDEDEFPCAFLVRCVGADESFESGFFNSNNGAGSYYRRVSSKGDYSLTTEWEAFEYGVTIYAEDLEDTSQKSWMFCLDNMEAPESAKEIDLRSFAVYLEDEYEPAEKPEEPEEPEETKAPAGPVTTFAAEPLNTPINFSRYPITFSEVAEGPAVTPAPAPAETAAPTDVTEAPADTAAPETPADKGSSDTLIIVIAVAVAALLVAAAVVVLIKFKNKGDKKA